MGKGHQGVVGPLLQPEGQSCFPRTNWLPPEGVPVHVAAVPRLRMWGSVLPVHSLIALGLGPGLRLASDGCTKGETQGCGCWSPLYQPICLRVLLARGIVGPTLLVVKTESHGVQVIEN